MASTSRPWKLPLAVVLVIAVIGGYLVLAGNRDGEAAEDTEAPARQNSTAVVRTDLVEVEEFDGTLRAIEEDSVAAAAAGAITAIAADAAALVEGDLVYAVDGTAVPLMFAPTAFYRDLSLGGETLTVDAVRAGTVTSVGVAGAIVEQGDVLYTFDGEPVTVLYGESLVYRDLYWPEPDASTSRSTLASDVQSDQTRQRLVEAIDDAEERVVDAQADRPSNATLNAIDDLTEIERAGGSYSQISRANQALAVAQQAEVDRLEAAEVAVETAQQALIDFDQVQAAATTDDLRNETTPEVQPNLVGPDVLQLETALVALGYDIAGDLEADREFTSETAAMVERWQADIGVEVDGVVHADDIIFVSGPAQVVEILDAAGAVGPGMQIAKLTAGQEIVGPDVLQLEQALDRMGFTADDAMVVDDAFTAETRLAVIDWQRATGQEPDGVLHVGDVVIAEDAVRVIAEISPVGTEVNPGTVVVKTALVEQIVSFDLDASDQSFADEGDTATVTLPGNVDVSAFVEEIATTATTSPDGTTVFEVTVRLDDPTAAVDLTQAPVDVALVGSSVSDVLAVPVSALIALSDGGYAIQADSGSGFRLVAVDPGFFADGLVEIDVEGIAAGDDVQLP